MDNLGKLNTMPGFEGQIKEASLLNDNVVKIPGTSGFWLVKADTPEAKERESSPEAVVVLTKEIEGKKYLICRR